MNICSTCSSNTSCVSYEIQVALAMCGFTLYLGTSLMFYKWDRVTSYSTIFYASYIDREHLSPEQHLAT